MAEFVNVMMQMERMCTERHSTDSACLDCPIQGKCVIAYATTPELTMLVEKLQDIEKSVMQWAEAHPEPKLVYPTFAEWQRENFPEVCRAFHPCTVMYVDWSECRKMGCNECSKKTRIPEDVAKKLGIEPREVAE